MSFDFAGTIDQSGQASNLKRESVLETPEVVKKKRKNYCNYCCVFNCHNNTVKNKELTFFYVKRKRSLAQTEAWVQAIHRENDDKTDWEPSNSTIICSIHFLSGKFST